jgi:hypothetical protein
MVGDVEAQRTVAVGRRELECGRGALVAKVAAVLVDRDVAGGSGGDMTETGIALVTTWSPWCA